MQLLYNMSLLTCESWEILSKSFQPIRGGGCEEGGMQARMTSQFKLVKTVGYIQDQVTLLGTTFRTCKKSYNVI
jgi:hypothetical protein